MTVLDYILIAIVVLGALRFWLPDDTPAYAARGDVMAAPFSANSDSQPRNRTAQDGEHEPYVEVAKISWFDQRMRPWLVASSSRMSRPRAAKWL